jgi:GntR family transcriptional regulator, galactonate operon transcriptional repressor
VIRSLRGGTPLATIGGGMQVRGILGGIVSDLGCRIVGGEWKSGDILPKESDFISQLGVSRSVVREAIRILNAKGLVRSRQMEGTKVMPRAEWRHLDPDVIGWRMLASDRQTLLKDLLLVRLALEPGAVRLATLNKSPESHARVDAAWQRKVELMTETAEDQKTRRAAFIASDLEFHRALLAAVNSELLGQLFAVIEAALALLIDLQMRARGSTTTLVGMDQSMELHEAVYLAYKAGDAEAAQTAMRVLVECAIVDANRGFALIG